MSHKRTQRYLPSRLWVTHAALLLSLVLAAALGGPSNALADRRSSDTVGGVSLSAGEITSTVAPDVRLTAGLLLATDGRMLWGRDPQTARPMASITKVMTALLTLEQGDLDDVVTISKATSEVEDATGLLPGETFTVRELLELALVSSSNDAAYALAEHTGPTLPAFIAQMNAKAASLGLTHTHYANPHGLDAPGHHSSPADIASLSRTAMQSPEFRRIVALRSVTLPAHGARKARALKSTNELLGTYRGMRGVKTGFTNDAKHSFVASAERDGVTLTAVVLGASTNAARFAQCARLLDWGFAHFSLQTVTTTTETVGTVPLSANSAKRVTVRYAETTSVPVFDLDGAVTATTTLAAAVDLPVFEGQPLGEAIVAQGQRQLARVTVVAAASTRLRRGDRRRRACVGLPRPHRDRACQRRAPARGGVRPEGRGRPKGHARRKGQGAGRGRSTHRRNRLLPAWRRDRARTGGRLGSHSGTGPRREGRYLVRARLEGAHRAADDRPPRST